METEAAIRPDVYSIITDRIIGELEKGTLPWRKPWTDAGIPQNLITKRPYRGINLWMLASYGYARNLFLTFKQANDLGGRIKKGEKGQMVVYTKRVDVPVEQNSEETKEVSMLRYYKVFNISQCEGLQNCEIPEVNKLFVPIERCNAVLRNMPKCPPIRHERQEAFFDIVKNYINMPKKETFKNNKAYYTILFHELVHSTGHSSRLNRKELMEGRRFESEMYAMEELIAEIGACYLKSYAGITAKHFKDNASYIQSWLNRLKNDKRFIFSASSKAQKAVDYILNVGEV